MDEIQTPNLDGLDPDDLRQVRDVFCRLASYAQHKLDAMRLRSEGQITAALREEGLADDQYQQLPASVRW